MLDIKVQIATINELDAVAELFDLYRQFYEQPADISLAKKFIGSRIENNESIIFMAQNEHGTAVGFCQLYPSFCSVIAAPIYVLYDLFVVSSHRGSGAGRMLLLAAENYARRAGVSRLDLTTAKTNHIAQSLYESLGWEQDQIFIAYNRNI